MGDKRKEKTDAVLEWLRGFETLAQEPVVISLLIDNGVIEFRSAVTKKHWLELGVENDEEESPAVDLEQSDLLPKCSELKEVQRYIG